mgnify:FL=1
MAKLRVNKIAAVGVSTENTGSVFFDGTGDYLATEVSDDFALGTNDFTFEMWVYYESRSTGDTPAVLDSTTTTYAPLIGYIENDASTNGHAVVYISANGSSWGIASNKTFGLITAKQWYHLAISRSGSNFYLFKDGILTDSFTSSSAIHQGANQIGFGRIQSSVYFDGYISNARLCNGHAVYTENFTPPTRELEVHPETVFLGLYDGENIFAEKTGKIIAAYGDRLSSPTPTATDSPIGITTFNPGLTRSVDATAGPTFEGGVGYNSQNWLTLPKGTTTQRGRGRGLFAGGITPTRQNIIEFVNIASTGNIQDFGDLTRALNGAGGCASATRGLFGGGYNPSVNDNTIEFVTIATTGNAVDFGDLLYAPTAPGGLSNNTRGIFAGGDAPSSVNNINFVTISTLGDAKDFGDLLKKRRQNFGSCSSPTRGLFAGGYDDTSPASRTNVIEYITIATAGNGLDFGDLNAQLSFGIAGVSSKTRGVFMGGYAAPAGVNTIQYVTIATTGDAQDFGDLTISAFARSSGVSNSERGLAAGGATPTLTNTIDYITIATTGDAKDFGDLLVARRHPGGLSDSHGGIS